MVVISFLAVLKPGVVTVYEHDGATKKIFVSSGTITVNEDSSVQVLAEEAHPVEDLDSGACREILSSAQSQLSSASTDKVRTNTDTDIRSVDDDSIAAISL